MANVTTDQMRTIRTLAADKGMTYGEAIAEYGIDAGSGELSAYNATGIIEWLEKPAAEAAPVNTEFQAAMDAMNARLAEKAMLDDILDDRTNGDHGCLDESDKEVAREALRQELAQA